MNDETAELIRAVTELIGNIRSAKNVGAIARPGGHRAKETKKLMDGMSRTLRRHRKMLEANLKREDCTADERRLATEHIAHHARRDGIGRDSAGGAIVREERALCTGGLSFSDRCAVV